MILVINTITVLDNLAWLYNRTQQYLDYRCYNLQLLIDSIKRISDIPIQTMIQKYQGLFTNG